jgi:hypothetical protein
MSTDGVVLFHTSAAALRAEKVLGQAGLGVKLILTPRELSSDCGISLRFASHDIETVRSLLVAARVETAGIHVSGPAPKGGPI